MSSPESLPRLNFNLEEMKDDRRQSTPTPAPPADALFLSNLASSPSSQRGAAADLTDDNNRVSASASLSKTLSMGLRKDTPSFQPSKRFNKQLALSAAASESGKRAALKALDDDAFDTAENGPHTPHQEPYGLKVVYEQTSKNIFF